MEKRSEEYNKYLLKRFFKWLKKTQYKDNSHFLRILHEKYFEKEFTKGEFCEAFGCDDIFDEVCCQKFT